MLQEMRFPDALPVDSYGPGFFRVGGRVHHGPLLILPEAGVLPWKGYEDTARILAEAGASTCSSSAPGPRWPIFPRASAP
jgi:uncharacterized protein